MTSHFTVIRIMKNIVSGNKSSGKRIHASDMCQYDVFKVSRVSPRFGIKIYSSCFETTRFKDYQHCFCYFVYVIGKLVCIPTVLVVAPVGIDASQKSGISTNLQLMSEAVTGQNCMVDFNIEFEIFYKVILTQKPDDSSRVKVILVF